MQSQVQACKRLSDLDEENSTGLKLVKLDDDISTELSLESLGEEYFECTWCFNRFELIMRETHANQCPFRALNACTYCSRSLLNLNEYNRKTHIEHCRAKLNKTKKNVKSVIPPSPTNDSITESIFEKCTGYKPNIKYETNSLFSNFPFQLLDTERENIKFVIENGAFHNVNCAKKSYKLNKDHRYNVNKLCSDLNYHRYLQNILKRSQITNEFSSIPHSYLSYNQLKSEIDEYRDSLKKLKLENLNLKRTIESLRSKQESYKRFINLLAHKEHTKLNQIVTVCLNQKKGINGIIEKLLDTEDGIYHPRDNKSVLDSKTEDVGCNLCGERVNMPKMRHHIAGHMLKKDVNEHEDRCGFCGLCNTCSIGIKTTNQTVSPESSCIYFKAFSLKKLNKLSNHPVECEICKKIVWSFNLKSHLNKSHQGFHSESASRKQTTFNEIPCKICYIDESLNKMRDHVAGHLIRNEIESNPNTCGYCGQSDCEISIKITSGKGKNATYGPASDCEYFRKFNLKSSIRPTKSSPSTNRPIECHLCKKIFWSYNMKSHFSRDHSNEEAPELISDFEKEMVSKC